LLAAQSAGGGCDHDSAEVSVCIADHLRNSGFSGDDGLGDLDLFWGKRRSASCGSAAAGPVNSGAGERFWRLIGRRRWPLAVVALARLLALVIAALHVAPAVLPAIGGVPAPGELTVGMLAARGLPAAAVVLWLALLLSWRRRRWAVARLPWPCGWLVP